MACAATRSTECGACGEEGPATWQGGTCGGRGEAQGDVGAHQCRHVLPSPHIIVVIMSSLQWWGHGGLLRKRVCLSARRPIEHSNWAAKEEVSKKTNKEKTY